MQNLINKKIISILAPKRVQIMRNIQNCQHWDQHSIKHYQEEKLKEMIHYCWQYVPFYRSHWHSYINSPDDIQSLEDLQKLPVLTKDQLRAELPNLTTTANWVKSEEARTGGSTGQPIIFRMTKEDQEFMWAQMYVGWHWAGYSLGDPFLVVGGESIGIGLSDRRTLKDKLMNRWVFSGSNLTKERVKALIAVPHFKKIRFIYGYPNAIRELGELLAEIGTTFPKLQSVVCTAEVMRPEVRQRIEETLGVTVFDQYGLNDGGLLAVEGKEHNGLHVFPHRGILEILDDHNQQIHILKQSGRAVATCLSNFVTPFIRYETGDMVHWHDFEPAASGIGWPRIGPVDGRTGDVIYLPSGRSIAMPGLTLVMRWLDGLHQYQFIQTGSKTVTVRLDCHKTFALNEEQTKAFLAEKISNEINWHVVWDKPELTRNNKILIIRNDWLRHQGLNRPLS